MTLPTTNTQYTVTFTQPTLTMVLQRQFLPKLGRFIDYKVLITLPIMPDNTLRMSEYQMSRIIEMFKAELVDMLADGLDLNQVGAKEVVIEPVPTEIEQELIPVVKAIIGDDEVHAVNAKLLHSFLEVKSRFNDWIDRRIKEYGFIMDLDFYSFLSKSTGGRKATEYILSFDMAKELSMVENNDKGREARRYFIACEKKLRQIEAQPVTCGIQEQLDEALKARQQIGDKKVATALGRVGNLVKKNNELARENQALRRRLAVV